MAERSAEAARSRCGAAQGIAVAVASPFSNQITDCMYSGILTVMVRLADAVLA
jgi:hypothetical protein